MSNRWFVATDTELSFGDIRDVTEQTLRELLEGSERSPVRVQVTSSDDTPLTDAELGVFVTGPRAEDDSEALLRLPTGDHVVADAWPRLIWFGPSSGSRLAELLGIAAAIGVARMVGGTANYGDSILPDRPATREFDGHDPDELLAQLRLEDPVSDLPTAVRAILAKTIWASDNWPGEDI